MPKAVQFDSYGGIDVLKVRDVPRPVPGAGEVLVEVRAAGINPSEAGSPHGETDYLIADSETADAGTEFGHHPAKSLP
jgi:NADPH:quinone reductase-like Zn-dependent oxidoreductase